MVGLDRRAEDIIESADEPGFRFPRRGHENENKSYP